MGFSSFHDELARRAVRDGNSSAEFRAGARSNANWTWGWVIVAGLVWYFASWPWALVPFAVAMFKALQSISSTAVARRLERKAAAMHDTSSFPSSGVETIVRMEDVERIYALNRAGWEAYAKGMVHPGGWKIQLQPHESGTGVACFDAKTGRGLGVQAIYHDDSSSPDMLVVSSYFPDGTLPGFPDNYGADLKKSAQEDLGDRYSVKTVSKRQGSLEVVELLIFRVLPRAKSSA